MLHLLWNLAAFIVALGILVTIHEWGHFWVARRCGVFVERFSIGFGKALWRRVDKQGTEYVIALIPLGGYVKMLDERIAEVEPARRSQAFNNKTVGQRAAVIAAGPLANFLFAVVAWWLVFMIGLPTMRPIVERVLPDSIAQQAGLRPGTELLAVNGIETPDWDSVRLELLNQIGARSVTITVREPGNTVAVSRTLNLTDWHFDPEKQEPVMSLGVLPRMAREEPVIAQVLAGSAAERAGLQAEDRIIAVNGAPLDAWYKFVGQVRASAGKPLRLEIARQGERLSVTVIPQARRDKDAEIGVIGVMPRVLPLADSEKKWLRYGPVDAFRQAGIKTWRFTVSTVTMLGKLMTGDVKLNTIGGPASIAKGAGDSAGYGFVYYLIFLALISVNLGVVNLFPLPVLDGGHLLFLVIEKLKGGPVSARIQDVSFRIGSLVLVLLMGLALFNDFSRF